MSRNEFEQRKRGIIAVLYGADAANLKSDSEIRLDRSLKGKVDDEFQEFCEMINNHPDYVTTSCCSGRITIYRGGISNRKIGGALLFVSHEIVDESLFSAVQKCLTDGTPYYSSASTCLITPAEDKNAETFVPEAEVTLKMEPFVIHIECSSLLAARRLLQTASSLGFKNSGANTVGPKRVIVALRGSHRVEVPLRRALKEGEASENGLIVPAECIPSIVRFCNEKMTLNSENIKLLHENVQKVIDPSSKYVAPIGTLNKIKTCCSCAETCGEEETANGKKKVGGKRSTPSEKMETAFEILMRERSREFTSELVEKLSVDLPTKKFEKLGDALVFHSLPSAWEEVSEEGGVFDGDAWSVVANCLGVRIVAVETGRGIEGTTRVPGVRVLSKLDSSSSSDLNSSPCWVLHKENGVSYQVKIDQLMFASGNGTERARMGAIVEEGEEVVDMFSGLGYFSLPILMSKKAKRLTCLDINPIAHHALKKGILSNKRATGVSLSVNGEYQGIVHSKNSIGSLQKFANETTGKDEGVNPTQCEMYLGNSYLAATNEGPGGEAIFGRADRILLGLIPTSTGAWEAALRLINQEKGGILHVHENAMTKEKVIEMVVDGFKLHDKDSKWDFTVEHVEKVKNYAPSVYHFVVDLKVAPKNKN